MPTISDPAAQLHAMCSVMANFAPRKSSTIGQVVLAELLDVEANTSEYFMGIGAIASRFNRLETLATSVFEEPYLSLLLNTLKSLQNAVSAHSQMNHWLPLKETAFSSANMQTLLMASGVIRHHVQISVPTLEERKVAIEMIDEAIAALKNHHGAISESLHAALHSTRRMIVRFDLYGVDTLTEELLKAFALKTATENTARGTSTERSAWTKAGAALMMVAATLVASDGGLTALENHYGRAQMVLAFFASEQKRLPPPESHDANSQAVLPKDGVVEE